MEFIWWKCEKEKGKERDFEKKWMDFEKKEGILKKEREKEIILNKQIPSSAPCKDFLPWPLTNLTSVAEKSKHIWFSSSSFEKSCEVDLSPECQYFPFPIFSEFENSQAEPLTTTLTFLPAIFFNWPPLYISLVIEQISNIDPHTEFHFWIWRQNQCLAFVDSGHPFLLQIKTSLYPNISVMTRLI